MLSRRVRARGRPAGRLGGDEGPGRGTDPERARVGPVGTTGGPELEERTEYGVRLDKGEYVVADAAEVVSDWPRVERGRPMLDIETVSVELDAASASSSSVEFPTSGS